MIEFTGRGEEGSVAVSVYLDSGGIGTLYVTLAQWDRLREHRRDGRASEGSGLQIVVEAHGAEA